MFRTVPLSINRSLFTVHSAIVYVIEFVDSFRAGSGCSMWINSWWWTEELSETWRVSCQNKFVKFVYLVVFITKKFITMHGHMNVKKDDCLFHNLKRYEYLILFIFFLNFWIIVLFSYFTVVIYLCAFLPLFILTSTLWWRRSVVTKCSYLGCSVGMEIQSCRAEVFKRKECQHCLQREESGVIVLNLIYLRS